MQSPAVLWNDLTRACADIHRTVQFTNLKITPVLTLNFDDIGEYAAFKEQIARGMPQMTPRRTGEYAEIFTAYDVKVVLHCPQVFIMDDGPRSAVDALNSGRLEIRK